MKNSTEEFIDNSKNCKFRATCPFTRSEVCGDTFMCAMAKNRSHFYSKMPSKFEVE